MEKIQILHTNDLHSHLENWPKIRRFLKQQKADAAAKNQTVIAVDLGDFVDRWHPLTEATNGQANVQLMNQIGYDAVTIGNNEGVGNSKYDLNHLYREANFDVLLDNLFDKKTLSRPKWAQTSKIIVTEQGSKVGLIAMTAPFPLTYSPNGWDIRTPYELLPGLIAELRDKVDVLVLMSHLGIGDDKKIAAQFPEIDVILGSHTHHLFLEGKKIGDVQLAAAGKFGNYIGEVEVELDNAHQIVKTSARTLPTSKMAELPGDLQEIEGYLEEGHRLLQEHKVAKIPYPLEADINSPHPLIQIALAALKEKTETDVSILNSGLFLEDIPAGAVDQDQLHQTLPHPMHLIRVTLEGRDVIRLILEMEKNRNFLRHFPILGMGFRGKVFGDIVYNGIDYDGVNHEVRWLGEEIDEEGMYSLTTVDHFLFVPFFPTIEIAGVYEFIFPEFIRSVVGDYLQKYFPIQD